MPPETKALDRTPAVQDRLVQRAALSAQIQAIRDQQAELTRQRRALHVEIGALSADIDALQATYGQWRAEGCVTQDQPHRGLSAAPHPSPLRPRRFARGMW